MLVSSAFALSPAVTNGLNYLTSIQNSDGSWGSDTSGVEILPSTVSVIETLQLLNQTGAPNYPNALSWLQSQGLETTDYLSERIYALSAAGTDSALLISYIDSVTGAWGGEADYEVNNLDTVWALQALQKINYADQTVMNNAISCLISTQNPDGGWGFSQGDDSNVYMTAVVVNTFSQFMSTNALLTPIINAAAAYLFTEQNSDGGFGASGSTVYETAVALQALVASGAAGADKSVNMQNAINYVISTQLSDGSWNDDPYSTSLALQALADLKPNLSIASSDITFSDPTPTQGETITMTATIRNVAPSEADNVLVYFYDGNPASGGVLIGQTTIPSIPAYGSSQASISWTIPTASANAVYVVVNPLNSIAELTQSDNGLPRASHRPPCLT